MSAESSQKQKLLPERTREMVKQIESVEQKANAFIKQMEDKQRSNKGNLSELDKKRLEAAREIASELSLLKDQIIKTGNARASYEQMKNEVMSWEAGAKDVLMHWFAAILPKVKREDVKEMEERQFNAMENAGAALLTAESSLKAAISNIDKMADHLLNGDRDAFLQSVKAYMRNTNTLLSNIEMMKSNVEELERNREIFEGASKVAKDFFIDAATVVVSTAALGAVAKMGKVQKLMRLAKEEAEIGKYWYQTSAGVLSKTLPRAVEGTVAVIGNYLKEGKLDVKDATLIMACAFIPHLGAEFNVPKEHMKVGQKVGEMLEQVKNGKIKMEKVVEYVKQNMPQIKELVVDETSAANPTEIMKGLKKMYRKVKVAGNVGKSVVAKKFVKEATEVGKEVAIDISRHELRDKKHESNEAQNEQQESNKN